MNSNTPFSQRNIEVPLLGYRNTTLSAKASNNGVLSVGVSSSSWIPPLGPSGVPIVRGVDAA